MKHVIGLSLEGSSRWRSRRLKMIALVIHAVFEDKLCQYILFELRKLLFSINSPIAHGCSYRMKNLSLWTHGYLFAFTVDFEAPQLVTCIERGLFRGRLDLTV